MPWKPAESVVPTAGPRASNVVQDGNILRSAPTLPKTASHPATTCDRLAEATARVGAKEAIVMHRHIRFQRSLGTFGHFTLHRRKGRDLAQAAAECPF